MRWVTLAIVILCSVSFLGCLSIGGSSVTWSENIAVFAGSKDSKLNDDNIHSVGETQPLIAEAGDKASIQESDRYTQALLEWGKPQKIQRVIIKAAVGDLEFFDVQYRNAEGEWKTIKELKTTSEPNINLHCLIRSVPENSASKFHVNGIRVGSVDRNGRREEKQAPRWVATRRFEKLKSTTRYRPKK